MQFGLKNLSRLVFSFLAAWLALRLLFPLISPFFFGMLLAIAAEPVVSRLQKRLKLPRTISTGIGVSLTFTLICTLLLLLCTFAVREVGRLALSVPDLAAPVQSGILSLRGWLMGLTRYTPENLQPMLSEKVDSIFSSGTALLDQIVGSVLGFAGNLLSHIPNSALTLGTGILSAYMISAKLPALRSQLLSRMSRDRLREFRTGIRRMRNVITCWILAQCKLMGVTFLLLAPGLLLLRVPHAIAAALGISLLDALPVLGTGTILIPWSLLRLLQGDTAFGIGLLGIYATISLIRSGLEPKLLGQQLGMDPLLTLLCLYVGFRLWGIGGMLLAPLITVTALHILPDSGR